jgi:hypothetical protein
VLAGTIETLGRRPMLEPVISPALDLIAYLSSPEVAPERTDLLFVNWADTMGDPTFYTSTVDSFDDWSPGGERFSFNRPPSEIASISAFTGRIDEEPKPVGDGESVAIDVRWIDDDRYLYLQASDKGWNLLLTDDSGVVTPIAAVVGQPPAFDVMQ